MSAREVDLPIPQARGRMLLRLRAFRADPLAEVARACAELGDTFQFSALSTHVIFTRDPAFVQRILVDNQRNYRKRTRGYDVMRRALGEGLVTSDGEVWRRQRRLMQPAFHGQRVAAFGQTMVDATLAALRRWEDRAPAPMLLAQEMNALTLAVVCRTLFGADAPGETAQVARDLAELNRYLARNIRDLLAPPPWVPTPSNLAFRHSLGRLDQVVAAIIAARRARGPGGGGADADLLDLLMAATDEETGAGMSDAQLRDEVMTLFVAGHETTATHLVATFTLLDRHPKVRARLEDELDAVLAGRPPTVEDLRRLPWLDQVIRESLRLLPPVTFFARSAAEADRLGPYAVPAGSLMLISPWILHRHSGLWSDPEAFDPARFEPLRGGEVRGFIPFAVGQRACIGAAFAAVEAKLVLATVMGRGRLTLQPGADVGFAPAVTLQPRGPLPVVLTPRTPRLDKSAPQA